MAEEQGNPMDGAVEEATRLFEEALGTETPGAAQGDSDEGGEGQGPESPTGTAGEGVAGEEEAAGEQKEPESKDGEEKPPPYDRDPKWKAARAAEQKLNELLEKFALTSPDDLEEALNKGITLDQTLGEDEDIASVVKEARQFRDWKRQQTEEEAKRQEEEETPEQTIERQRRELRKLQQQEREREEQEKVRKQSERSLQRFEKAVRDIASAEFESDTTRNLALQLLGVENPMDKVDIDDRQAVVSALKENVPRTKEAIRQVQQEAVDAYVSGTSKLVPTPKKGPETGQQRTEESEQSSPGSEKTKRTETVVDPSGETDELKRRIEGELARMAGIANVHQ